MQISAAAHELLDSAISAFQIGPETLTAVSEAIEPIEAPIYLTDARGVVTHFNTACVGFAGRRPAVGKDAWCVSWKLYTSEGDPLPHDECPMAVAIRTGRPVRGVSAIAERPDGTRIKFMPLPTPLHDRSGKVVGAINMLIDVTDARQVEDLRSKSQTCRRLADASADPEVQTALSDMSAGYDQMASDLEQAMTALQGRLIDL